MFQWIKIFQNKKCSVPYHPEKKPEFDMPLTIENIKNVFKGSNDFSSRKIYIGGNKEFSAEICYIDGMVNQDQASDAVLKPFMENNIPENIRSTKQVIEHYEKGESYNLGTRQRETMDDVVEDLLNGFCAMIFDEENLALTFEVKSFNNRGVTEPSSESVVKGAKDSFVEILRTNTGLIRRKLRAPDLKVEEMVLGRQSRSRVAIVYMEKLTNPELVKKVRARLDAIDVESLISAVTLEEYLVDGQKSVFPMLLYTERPDKFCFNILEGRVGVLVDGMPIGYMLPATFEEFVRAPEDKANNYIVASVITMLRYLGMCITLLLPGAYVAIAVFHQEMIPVDLAQAIIASKQNVPFSAAAEVLGMLVAFEVLQEAGLRLPKTIGQTVSIIGALVVGQSAVEANIFSPVVVIVVAVAGIAGYIMPNQDFASALRIWRFVIVIMASIIGMYGLAIAGIVLIYHLASIETFGVAYLTPVAGADFRSVVSGTLLRRPLKKQKMRHRELKPLNKRSRL